MTCPMKPSSTMAALLVGLTLAVTGVSSASASGLTYEGFLAGPGGAAIADGSLTVVKFQFFDAEVGAATENALCTWEAYDVPMRAGRFRVDIAGTAPGAGEGSCGTTLDGLLESGLPLWMEISIASASSNGLEALAPRIAVLDVPRARYAERAATVEQLQSTESEKWCQGTGDGVACDRAAPLTSITRITVREDDATDTEWTVCYDREDYAVGCPYLCHRNCLRREYKSGWPNGTRGSGVIQCQCIK